MMRFLQTHVALPHFHSSLSSFPSFGLQVMPTPSVSSTLAATAPDWHPRMSVNVPTGSTCVHPDSLTRDSLVHSRMWGCTGNTSQVRASVVGQEGETDSQHPPSSPRSPCPHTSCCSEWDKAGIGADPQQSPFQTSRTTPNSPYMSQQHARPAPTLLGISLCSSGMTQPIGFGGSVATPSTSRPICSHGNLSQSHPSLSLPVTSDLSRSHSGIPTPIQTSLTPVGQSQLHTVVSPLLHTGICSPGSNLELLLGHGHPAGSRQNNLVGSSPVHTHEPPPSPTVEPSTPENNTHLECKDRK